MAEDQLPESVTAHGLAVINVVMLSVYLLFQFLMKWLEWRAKRAETQDIRELSQASQNLFNLLNMRVESTNTFQTELKSTLESVRTVLTELLQRQAGAMNRDNSLRIVELAFQNAMRDIVVIFTASLESNGYTERSAFIRNRVKTAIGQTLENLRSSLGYFQMSVDIAPFFRSDATDEQGERYVLANLLWQLVEPLYRSSLPIKDRLEEMRLIVPNRVRDYIAATKTAIIKSAESGVRGAVADKSKVSVSPRFTDSDR